MDEVARPANVSVRKILCACMFSGMGELLNESTMQMYIARVCEVAAKFGKNIPDTE